MKIWSTFDLFRDVVGVAVPPTLPVLRIRPTTRSLPSFPVSGSESGSAIPSAALRPTGAPGVEVRIAVVDPGGGFSDDDGPAASAAGGRTRSVTEGLYPSTPSILVRGSPRRADTVVPMGVDNCAR
jgi:hypothetical protein